MITMGHNAQVSAARVSHQATQVKLAAAAATALNHQAKAVVKNDEEEPAEFAPKASKFHAIG